jgi:hypothetical protein
MVTTFLTDLGNTISLAPGYPRRMSYYPWYGPNLTNGHAKPLPMDVLRTWRLVRSPTYFESYAQFAEQVRSELHTPEDAPWEIQLKRAYPDVVEAVNRQTNTLQQGLHDIEASFNRQIESLRESSNNNTSHSGHLCFQTRLCCPQRFLSCRFLSSPQSIRRRHLLPFIFHRQASLNTESAACCHSSVTAPFRRTSGCSTAAVISDEP